jgi:hypothetical protein
MVNMGGGPLKITRRGILKLMLVARFDDFWIGEEETKTLFDGTIDGVGILNINKNVVNYLEIQIITSEWTEVVSLADNLSHWTYIIPPGRLTIKIKNIGTGDYPVSFGELWKLWVE